MRANSTVNFWKFVVTFCVVSVVGSSFAHAEKSKEFYLQSPLSKDYGQRRGQRVLNVLLLNGTRFSRQNLIFQFLIRALKVEVGFQYLDRSLEIPPQDLDSIGDAIVNEIAWGQGGEEYFRPYLAVLFPDLFSRITSFESSPADDRYILLLRSKAISHAVTYQFARALEKAGYTRLVKQLRSPDEELFSSVSNVSLYALLLKEHFVGDEWIRKFIFEFIEMTRPSVEQLKAVKGKIAQETDLESTPIVLPILESLIVKGEKTSPCNDALKATEPLGPSTSGQ